VAEIKITSKHKISVISNAPRLLANCLKNVAHAIYFPINGSTMSTMVVAKNFHMVAVEEMKIDSIANQAVKKHVAALRTALVGNSAG